MATVEQVGQVAQVGQSEIEANAAEQALIYRTPYPACPICGLTSCAVAVVCNCTNYPAWHAPLPEKLTWLRCDGCGHIFTDSYYTQAGLDELFRNAFVNQLAGGDLERMRILWAPVVQFVLQAMPDHEKLFNGTGMSWLDVGCGAGGLVATAEEFGFAATGIDLREEAAQRLRDIGYAALKADIFTVQTKAPLDVISMADLLEHSPYPVTTLLRAHQLLHPQGALYISCPNRDSSSWRQMDRNQSNPYWGEIEHYHNFSRKSLMWLLAKCGFQPVAYTVSNRYISCMEIVAVKAQPGRA
jgi:SAM-dependent methyltransferase